jgi:hypothetical protein
MIGMIAGVSAGALIFLVLCFFVWRKLQNKHTLEVQKQAHDHEVQIEESRNRGAMIRLAETPQGLRALQLLGGQIGNGGPTNRLAIGDGNGPYAGGGGGRVFDVSLSQVSNYEILGV